MRSILVLLVVMLAILMVELVFGGPPEDYILDEMGLDLTAFYQLDDTNVDIIVLDSSPNLLHGVALGDSVSVNSIIHESLGGVVGAVDIISAGAVVQGTSQPISAFESFSIAMWVTVWLPPDIGEQRGLFRKGNNLGADIYFNEITDKYTIEVVYEQLPHGQSADIVVDGNPHLIVCTYAMGIAESKIYLDGVLLGAQSIGIFGWGGVTTPWLFGQVGNTPSGDKPLLGIIDNVAVWTREVSSSEISELYARGLRGERFIRGDCNSDGSISIADLTLVLSPAALCQDACDANRDGFRNIADIVYLAGYLFSGGPQPSGPFPMCGYGLEYGLRCQATAPVCQ